MSQLSPILRDSVDNGLTFWCPGCGESHCVRYGAGSGPRWTWNGDIHNPTFSPSILVRTGHYASHGDKSDCWCTYNAAHPEEAVDFECRICHSFVTDGRIQFLSDCSHALAGQTVDLPAWLPASGGFV